MANDNIARVRLKIGDRGDPPQFSDAEIQLSIDDAGDWRRACLHLVKSQIADLAGEPGFGGGSLRVSHSGRYDALKALLNNLRAEFNMWNDGVASGATAMKSQYERAAS